MKDGKHIVIGISGASGATYGIRILQLLQAAEIKTHLVISKAAALTIKQELGISVSEVEKLADFSYASGDISAPISSGSFKTMGMIVAPCSMRSLAEISTGMSTSLLSRAADVVLKERNKLVLMVRETPLHSIHLRHMANLSDMGVIIAPPVPAFYNHPKTIDDIVNHSVGRVLDLFDLDLGDVKRWHGME